jgi:hypothetical protein
LKVEEEVGIVSGANVFVTTRVFEDVVDVEFVAWVGDGKEDVADDEEVDIVSATAGVASGASAGTSGASRGISGA